MPALNPSLKETSVVEPGKVNWDFIRQVLYAVFTLILFIFALDLMISSLRNLGGRAAETIILATSNPFTAFFIGLLITAMIQSSSTTTAMAVALVASGSISLENAIPVVMGANIGTTITSTVVSLTFISKKKEFRRAVAAGTYHDFFNLLTASVLFPLEYFYGLLSHVSRSVAGYFVNPDRAVSPSTDHHFLPLSGSVINFFENLIPSNLILTLLSFVFLLSSILLFRKLIANLLRIKGSTRVNRLLFKNRFLSFVWGLVATAAIRSSTVTTSLVVPLVAKKVITLKKGSPFIIGANIGTTITAFIAAILNANTHGSISLAITHFLFNFAGMLLFFPVPVLRRIPVALARYMGRLAFRNRYIIFVYILIVFFLIPFLLIYSSHLLLQ